MIRTPLHLWSIHQEEGIFLEADDDGWAASLNDARWCNCGCNTVAGDGLSLSLSLSLSLRILITRFGGQRRFGVTGGEANGVVLLGFSFTFYDVVPRQQITAHSRDRRKTLLLTTAVSF